MDNVTIFALIAAIGTICGVIFNYFGYQRGIKKESEDEGSLKSDMQYIKRRADDTLLELRSVNTTLSTHSERITRVEESAKQAHKRIDELKENQHE